MFSKLFEAFKAEYNSYDPACKIMFWFVGGGSVLMLIISVLLFR